MHMMHRVKDTYQFIEVLSIFHFFLPHAWLRPRAEKLPSLSLVPTSETISLSVTIHLFISASIADACTQQRSDLFSWVTTICSLL